MPVWTCTPIRPTEFPVEGTTRSPPPSFAHDIPICDLTCWYPIGLGWSMFKHFFYDADKLYIPVPDSSWFHYVWRGCCITWLYLDLEQNWRPASYSGNCRDFWSLLNLSVTLGITLERRNPGNQYYLDRTDVLKIKLESGLHPGFQPSSGLEQLCSGAGSQQWCLGLTLVTSLGTGPCRSPLCFWCLLN